MDRLIPLEAKRNFRSANFSARVAQPAQRFSTSYPVQLSLQSRAGSLARMGAPAALGGQRHGNQGRAASPLKSR